MDCHLLGMTSRKQKIWSKDCNSYQPSMCELDKRVLVILTIRVVLHVLYYLRIELSQEHHSTIQELSQSAIMFPIIISSSFVSSYDS